MNDTPSAAPASESVEALIGQAWQLSYYDAPRALELGRRIVALTRHDPQSLAAGFGWLHVALAEVRVGDIAVAREATEHAREVFLRAGHRRGLSLADEVHAIQRRRAGDVQACADLHAAIDERADRGYDDHDQFIAHNSRAITAKLLGRADHALRHFYDAHAAAKRTGWMGPIILSLGNLGGFHQDLYNLDDARLLCEQALRAAREGGALQSMASAAANLIIIHHALGQVAEARAMGEFLRTHADKMPPGTLDRLTSQMALAHLAAGEIEAAQRYLERGATHAVADGDGRAFWTWLKARCALAAGDAPAALEVARAVIVEHQQGRLSAQPYDLLQIHRAAADAAEKLGDLASALAFTRSAQALYEELVGRSARARYIALEVAHYVDAARQERDEAVQSRQSAEHDRERLAELNTQLRTKIAETERLQAQLKEQALRDPLTGLHNRRYLFEMAPRLIDLAERAQGSVCVVVLDLDHFKQLNDNFGHQAGDEVLKAFSALLSHSLRRSDVLCRHGGEEFVIVMPEITLDGAEAMLARLMTTYGELRLNSGLRQLPAGSFSAGVAIFSRHGKTLDQLLSSADRALYAAKEAGRARVEVAQATNFATLN